jgi:hypothetical protein
VADKTAKSIDNSIGAKDTLKVLRDNKLLQKYIWEEKELKENAKTNIHNGSDESWPIELQNSWPFFIQGVSEMLLELIAQIKNQITDERQTIHSSAPIASIEKYYLNIEERLLTLWNTTGSHAFFHHINALFGYAPLVSYPRNIHGFIASF